MDTNESETIVLAQLALTDRDTQTHPVQLHCSSSTGRGAFYHHNTRLRIARFVQTSHLIRNSGDQHNRMELHDQEDAPLEHLHELIEHIKAGHMFHFEF